MITRNINDDSTLSYLFRQITDWLKFRKGGKGAAFGKAAERDNELDIGNWKLTCGNLNVPLFKVIRHTKTGIPTINAWTTVNVSITITPQAGYTPIGVVGFGGSNNGNLAYCDCDVSGSTVVSFWARNNSSSAVTPNYLFVDVLFVLSETVSQKAY